MNLSPESIFVFQLTPLEALASLSVALICGIFIGFMYRLTYRGVNYSDNYIVAIIMLTMITALIILVIGNNLARAFGLVGAMSIIRFRTAVKDIQDIMFIFFALAIGLACGAGMYLIGMIATVFIGIAVWVAVLVNSENARKKEYLLQIYSYNQQKDMDSIIGEIKKYCSKYKLINVKSLGEGERKVLEISYYINLRNQSRGAELIDNIKSIKGIEKVNLFFDED